MQLIIVTGLSGSGKSIVLKALEDSGYYCVDNLPATLLPDTAEHLCTAGQEKIAVSIDTRSSTLEALPAIIPGLRARGSDVRVLFLESSTETLVKRFSETRRRHPLSDTGSTLAESIRLEREMLAQLGDLGHRIDTSNLGPNTLRSWVKDFVSLEEEGLTLMFTSFGFKHGLPLDADYVFDVRCLPNPNYEPNLKPLTGRDQPVVDFLDNLEQVQSMYEDIYGFVEKWLPCFIRDNRSYLTVAVGCTGGQHRSVYFTERLAKHFSSTHPKILVRHRELDQRDR